jgi:hypothetical protein
MKLLVTALLAVGTVCIAQQQVPRATEMTPAKEVFARFCKLDAQGSQLNPDGWQELAALFVNPGRPQRKRIIVSDGGGPLRPSTESGRIGVGREYIQYGQIDLPQLRFSAANGLPPNIKVRTGMYMVKLPSTSGAEEWRIEGPVPEPVVNVDAAIMFIMKQRDETSDPAIEANANRTLATLRRFR